MELSNATHDSTVQLNAALVVGEVISDTEHTNNEPQSSATNPRDFYERCKRLSETERIALAAQATASYVAAESQLFNYRCVIGAICAAQRERERDLKRQKVNPAPMKFAKFCEQIGVDHKSALLWAANWDTIERAPGQVIQAATRQGLNLFLPRVARALAGLLETCSQQELEDAQTIVELLKSAMARAPKVKQRKPVVQDGPKTAADVRDLAHDLDSDDPSFKFFLNWNPDKADWETMGRVLLGDILSYLPAAERQEAANAFLRGVEQAAAINA